MSIVQDSSESAGIKNIPPLLLLFLKGGLATVNPLGNPGSIDSKTVLLYSPPY